MIPEYFIQEWSDKAPWQEPYMVEQDLIICKALVCIYSDEFLASQLAFRGGTALHKLYLQPLIPLQLGIWLSRHLWIECLEKGVKIFLLFRLLNCNFGAIILNNETEQNFT